MQRFDEDYALALESEYMAWKDRKREFLCRVQKDLQEISDLSAEIEGVEQDLDHLLCALSDLYARCYALSLPYLDQMTSSVCDVLSDVLYQEKEYLIQLHAVRTAQDPEAAFSSWKQKMMDEGAELLGKVEKSLDTLISTLRSCNTSCVYAPPELMETRDNYDLFI